MLLVIYEISESARNRTRRPVGGHAMGLPATNGVFLGATEVPDPRRPDVQVLCTRWSSRPAYERWAAAARLHANRRRDTHLEHILANARLLDLADQPTMPAARGAELLTLDEFPMVREFLEQSQAVAVVLVGRGGRILAGNAAFAAFAGLEPEQAAGMRLDAWLVPEDAARVRSWVSEGVAGAASSMTARHANGTRCTLIVRGWAHPAGILLLGEPDRAEQARIEAELHAITTELAAQAREQAVRARATPRRESRA